MTVDSLLAHGGLESERAIAIELQFVRPSRSFGQLGDCHGDHRLDEPDLTGMNLHDFQPGAPRRVLNRNPLHARRAPPHPRALACASPSW
jgi:hypothetical protein